MNSTDPSSTHSNTTVDPRLLASPIQIDSELSRESSGLTSEENTMDVDADVARMNKVTMTLLINKTC